MSSKEFAGVYVDMTGSGHDLDYLYPASCTFTVQDIARGMASTCRFAGQSNGFYSVAQHCVLMASLVPKAYVREAMLYGAAKAFCGDLPYGLKSLLPDYSQVVKQIDAAIRERFGLPATTSDPVNIANKMVLAAAKRDLMPPTERQWPRLEGAPNYGKPVISWHPDRARGTWLARWFDVEGMAA